MASKKRANAGKIGSGDRVDYLITLVEGQKTMARMAPEMFTQAQNMQSLMSDAKLSVINESTELTKEQKLSGSIATIFPELMKYGIADWSKSLLDKIPEGIDNLYVMITVCSVNYDDRGDVVFWGYRSSGPMNENDVFRIANNHYIGATGITRVLFNDSLAKLMKMYPLGMLQALKFLNRRTKNKK